MSEKETNVLLLEISELSDHFGKVQSFLILILQRWKLEKKLG